MGCCRCERDLRGVLRVLGFDHVANGPDEPDELSGHGGSHFARWFATVGELREFPVQTFLSLPGYLGHACRQRGQELLEPIVEPRAFSIAKARRVFQAVANEP